MEDSMIIALFTEHNEQAIVECRSKYGRYCRAIILRIVGNEEDAEEIENDVYLKAWQTIPSNAPSSLKLYLGMIARQLSFNHCEKQNAAKRGGYDRLILELDDAVSGTEDDPARRLLVKESLNSFLAGLPDRSRKIFLARYWYAYSPQEIAEAWKTDKHNIEAILCRTRKKLQKHLKENGIL